jgi:spoIIIJ-associated protein
VAAARKGRRDRPGPSGPGDEFAGALQRVLAEALGVDPERLEVAVRLDGDPVSDDRVVGSVGLVPGRVAPVADAEESGDTGGRDAEDRAEHRDEDRPAGSGRSERSGDGQAAPVTAEELDEEAEATADLLDGLLNALDLPGEFRISVHEAHAEVEIVGSGDGVLIGRRGQTLEAIQDLVRTAMQRRFERRSRVLVDVDGYRARRIEKLLERADEAVAEAKATGEPQRLEPMDAIERRLIHQRIASHGGVTSTSHGREPARRIVVEVAGDD